MIIPSTVLTRLAAKRTEVADALRKMELLEAELRGAEEIVRLFDDQASRGGIGALASAASREQETATSHHPATSDGRRGISAAYRSLLGYMLRSWPSSLSLDAMEENALEEDLPINRNTLRSQMSIYNDQGLVERVSKGHYRLTAAGAAAIGVELPVDAGLQAHFLSGAADTGLISDAPTSHASGSGQSDTTADEPTSMSVGNDEPEFGKEDLMHAARASPLG